MNWYHAASPQDRQEYDAFGPWIYELKSQADMPPRFHSFYASHQDADYLLKIPTKAERREMRPGMDLYVSVLAIKKDGICLMQLIDDAIVSRSVVWQQIAAVAFFKDLLNGRWMLLLTDGDRIDLSFSVVSSDLIDQVTALVRTRCIANPPQDHPPLKQSPIKPPRDISRKITDMFFRSALSVMKIRGPKPVRPLYFDAQNQKCRDHKNKRRRTTGLMILALPGELVIINRDSPTRKRFQACYASVKLFIPYNRISGFWVHAPIITKPARFHDLMLQLDDQIITQPCLNKPQAVMDTLLAMNIPFLHAIDAPMDLSNHINK